MYKRQDIVLSRTGGAISRATVTVTAYPGGGAVSIWTTDDATQPVIPSATVTTNDDGEYEYYVPTGRYIETIKVNGLTQDVKNDIQVVDSALVAFASQAEAEAGTINTKVMSPLRTKQAVDVSRPFASQSEAEAGTDNTKVMTPLRVEQATPGRFLRSTIFSASGIWTLGTDVGFVVVSVIGAGGGGGGIPAVTGGVDAAASAGGGGGSSAKKKILRASLGATETVTVGAGGTGGAAGATGSTGGTSSFGAHVTCTGGVGGPSMVAGTTTATVFGGAGGTATGGDVNFVGLSGGRAIRESANLCFNGAGGSTQGPDGMISFIATSIPCTVGTGFSNGGTNTTIGTGGAGKASAQGATAGLAGVTGGSGYVIVDEYS